MAIKTIVKNGKRVSASEKGKAKKSNRQAATGKSRKGRGILHRTTVSANGMAAPMDDQAGMERVCRSAVEGAAEAAGPKKAAPAPGKPAPLWENLKKPWSLPTCHRLIAIAVEHNNALAKRATLREQKKYLENERKERELTTADDKTLCHKLVHVIDDIKATKQKELAATADLVRIAIESVGGTVFEAGNDDSAQDVDGDEVLFPRGSEHTDTHAGIAPSKTPLDAAIDKACGITDDKQEPGSVKVADMTLTADTKRRLAAENFQTVNEVADFMFGGGNMEKLVPNQADRERLIACAKPFLPEEVSAE